jgi:GntR family transcriptional regulator
VTVTAFSLQQDYASITITMLDVKVHKHDPTDLYEQVAAEIRRAITDGEAAPGERLPPAKDLAAILEVNPNTIPRALRLLRDEGLLEFRRCRGICVARTPERGAAFWRASGRAVWQALAAALAKYGSPDLVLIDIDETQAVRGHYETEVVQHAIGVELPGLEWTAGAPKPFLVSTEDRTLFAFYRSDQDDTVRVAEFIGCTSVRFGIPNDQALPGHPFTPHRLSPYRAHEVIHSEWLNQLRTIEQRQPQSQTMPLQTSKHWMLTFQDTTLEAIAAGIAIHRDCADRPSAMHAIAELLSLV